MKALIVVDIQDLVVGRDNAPVEAIVGTQDLAHSESYTPKQSAFKAVDSVKANAAEAGVCART